MICMKEIGIEEMETKAEKQGSQVAKKFNNVSKLPAVHQNQMQLIEDIECEMATEKELQQAKSRGNKLQ